MDQDPSHRPDHSASAPRPGETAHAADRTLTSWRIAALPILDHKVASRGQGRFSVFQPRMDAHRKTRAESAVDIPNSYR